VGLVRKCGVGLLREKRAFWVAVHMLSLGKLCVGLQGAARREARVGEGAVEWRGERERAGVGGGGGLWRGLEWRSRAARRRGIRAILGELRAMGRGGGEGRGRAERRREAASRSLEVIGLLGVLGEGLMRVARPLLRAWLGKGRSRLRRIKWRGRRRRTVPGLVRRERDDGRERGLHMRLRDGRRPPAVVLR
jgi:hypothetical protein